MLPQVVVPLSTPGCLFVWESASSSYGSCENVIIAIGRLSDYRVEIPDWDLQWRLTSLGSFVHGCQQLVTALPYFDDPVTSISASV